MERPYALAAVSVLCALAMGSLALAWAQKSPEAVVIGLPGHHDVLTSSGQRLASCLDCHVPFVGTPPSRCLSPACHAPLATGTPPREGRAMPIRFHVAVRSEPCARCHLEHARNARAQHSKEFSHGILPDGIKPDCARCHSSTNLKDHASGRVVQCGVCHGTDRFNSVVMEHKKVSELHCDFCHVAPLSRSHETGIAGTCFPCHTTQTWAVEPKPTRKSP
ncbi:MAG: hypothetical protein HYV07_17620 [Deltaproteobacteria bacterium]|nr:hypothetical protein [Deltaproteobacteria bacterium]